MDLDDILFDTCHGINHITNNLDKSLHNHFLSTLYSLLNLLEKLPKTMLPYVC